MTNTPSRTEKLEEYKLIREEINKEWDYISASRSILFATTAAVLAFAFSQSNPIVFLIPYVVIIPLSAIEKDHLTGIIRKGAYLLVFCEPYIDIEWERRLFQEDMADASANKIKKPVVSHFMLLTLCCLVLSVLYLDFSDLKEKSLWVDAGLIAVFTVLTVVIVLRNRVDYLEEKIVQKERWEEVKKKKSK
ncbi:MAG: hypothetical protein LUI87_03490 [Lachnospiraceae bacterium]|nr:hypothetical protein [Lachnospiraceae bacterium]